MVASRYWGEINPGPPGVNYDIKSTTTRKKSGLVVIHEDIMVSFIPPKPLEYIDITFEIKESDKNVQH